MQQSSSKPPQRLSRRNNSFLFILFLFGRSYSLWIWLYGGFYNVFKRSLYWEFIFVFMGSFFLLSFCHDNKVNAFKLSTYWVIFAKRKSPQHNLTSNEELLMRERCYEVSSTYIDAVLSCRLCLKGFSPFFINFALSQLCDYKFSK